MVHIHDGTYPVFTLIFLASGNTDVTKKEIQLPYQCIWGKHYPGACKFSQMGYIDALRGCDCHWAKYKERNFFKAERGRRSNLWLLLSSLVRVTTTGFPKRIWKIRTYPGTL